MTQKPYISVETQKRMRAFFMKTSAPRIYEQKMKEEKERNAQVNNNKSVANQ